MTKQPEPVFAGLAIGLKPADIDMPADTITISDERLEILRASERLRTVRATERLADLAEQTLAAQLRAARAAERQAEALETLAALFAAVVGIGSQYCYGPTTSDPGITTPALFIRTGDGRGSFPCGGNPEDFEDDAD